MPFSLLKLIIHGNCAVKAKVAEAHCTGTNVTRNCKKKKGKKPAPKTPMFFIKCLSAHARSPGCKHEDSENFNKKFDSAASINMCVITCITYVLKC